MNCAIDHASGVAEPVPSPNLNQGRGLSGLSQTCSGIISPELAKPDIVSSRRSASARRPEASSYCPRSPESSAQSRPLPVYFPSQFQLRPSSISP